MKLKPKLCKCQRCGYEWYTRTGKLPKNCANPECKSPYWRLPKWKNSGPVRTIKIPEPSSLILKLSRPEFKLEYERHQEVQRQIVKAMVDGGMQITKAWQLIDEFINHYAVIQDSNVEYEHPTIFEVNDSLKNDKSQAAQDARDIIDDWNKAVLEESNNNES